ncbi:MAG: hypothetical protein AAF600_09260 [Bacteroidota bacterium]
MEQKTVIEEFRKLEEEFGPKKAQLLMDFVMKYSELLTRNLATKEDIHSVETNLHSIEANLLKTMNRQVIWFASLLGGLATLFTIIIKYL